jgi:Ni/Co efflux regulator RcnB
MKKLLFVLFAFAVLASPLAMAGTNADAREHLSSGEYRAYINGSMERKRQEEARERQEIRIRYRKDIREQPCR